MHLQTSLLKAAYTRAAYPSRTLPPRSAINNSASKSSSLRYHQFSSTRTANMPTYIITCKDDASDDQVANVKRHAQEQGGEIKHEYNIIKGFSCEFPDDKVNTLESHEHVKAVEADGEMRTQ